MKQCYGCFENYDESLGMCPYCGYEEGEEPEEALHLVPGRELKDTYIIGKVLGYGGFGVTYLGWNKVLKQKVAIKEYLPSEFSTRMPGQSHVTVFNGEKAEQFHDGVMKFVEEANRLAQFRNTDGIVRIFESFHENRTAYIVMEYLDGQTLTKHLENTGKLAGDEAVRLMMPIIQSLRTVHEYGIIHRDIAPDNIMVTKSGQVKLIDFGAARYATTSHSRSLTVVIKPGYSPEEQYRSQGDQGPWTDVYAVGATMYRMVTGQAPPDAMERRAFFEGKKKDILNPVSKYSKKIGDNLETAILNAMNVRIEDRTPDMAAFEHELTTQGEVRRRRGTIRKIDMLRWPLWMKVAIPAAACAVIALTYLFLTGAIGFSVSLKERSSVPEGMARVPSVVSNDLEKAEEKTRNKFIMQITGKEESDSIPENLVLSQSIEAGSVVRINSLLEIVISAGAESEPVIDEEGRVIAADLQFRSMETATRMLEGQGMVVIIEEEPSDVVAEGLVIRQIPVAGTPLARGAEVILIISVGSPPFDMPGVIGMDESEARAQLNDKGLSVDVAYIHSDDVEEGGVISQSLAAGSPVQRGEVVSITVSSGPDTSQQPNPGAGAGQPPNTNNGAGQQPNPGTGAGQAPNTNTGAGPSPNPGGGASTSPNPGAGASTSPSPNTGAGPTPSPNTGASPPPSPSAETKPPATPEVEPATLTRIDVKPPGKTTYNIGEGFSSSGMVVTATYSDGTTANVTSFCSASGFDSSFAGTRTVTVSYTEDGITRTAQFAVTINAATLSRIDVTPPGKTTYNIGEAFSSGGMVVTATYSDGTTKNVTSSCSTSGFDSSAAGARTVTVSYSEGGATRTAQFTVIVNAAILTRIDVTPPGKTAYNKGEAFSANGMVVTATYSDGTTKNVTSSCSTSGFDSSASGTRTITVSYTEDGITRTAQFTVSVNAVIFTVSFDAAGGSVATASVQVEAGTAIGTLPTPSRDYHDFIGWNNGSTQISSSFVVNSNVTLTAQWSQKAVSDWVPLSSAPSDAQALSYKWAYEERTTTTSTSSAMAGWTLYDQNATTVTGDWSAWSKTQPSAQAGREIEKRDIAAVTATRYRYYHYCKSGGYIANYAISGYSLRTIQATKVLSQGGTTSSGNVPYFSGHGACSVCGHDWWFPGSSYDEGQYWYATYPITVTVTAAYSEWRYRDTTTATTYYFEKTESKETAPSASRTAFPFADTASVTYRNMVEFVQYRPR